MKQLFFFASVLTIVLVTGCGRKPEAQSTTPAGTTPIDVSQLTQGTSTPSAPTGSQPVTTIKNTSAPVNITPQPTTTASGAVGLNPAHGQPGHRCDISVGEPLNSVPKNNTAPTVIQQPATMSPPVISSAPTTTPTAPGMNPPHGQPGHKCEIPVGSPLNSAPTKPANNNVPAISTIPIPAITTPPAKKDSN